MRPAFVGLLIRAIVQEREESKESKESQESKLSLSLTRRYHWRVVAGMVG
jgi:hypothetical protein